MKLIKRNDLPVEKLPGRMIQKAVGKGSYLESGKMTMGFATYSGESGPMAPHHHAEEVIYVVDSIDAWVRYGEGEHALTTKVDLQAGMILHFPPLEWHVFEFADGGHLDIVFIYGQVDHIRPEEME
jgi:mannose-6-phosphate isomerase-like protein (cupin superfamily)